MHSRWSVCLAIVVLTSASAAPLVSERLLEDDSGDYMRVVQGTDQPDSTNPSMDLLFLDIDEHVDGFWFTVGVEALERPGNDFTAEANVWEVYFRHGAQQYRLNFIWGIDGGWRTDMYRIDESGGSENFHDAAIERDFEQGTVRSFVPRDLLRDENGAPPMGGRFFHEIYVETQGLTIGAIGGETTFSSYDRMPDDGFGEPYPIAWGVLSDGPIAMSSALPFRSSNGAATTYLFEIDVVNNDGISHRYFFREPVLPKGWEIRFPADGLRLDAGESRTLPVLVSLPFAHQHGTIERAIIELEADNPDIVGRTEIGVLFLETPQPSGHHPQLWLHSNEQVAIEEAGWHFAYTPGADVYMNTLDSDLSDAEIPIRGYNHEDGYEWYVFLEPGLLTGLDFRQGDQGELSISIASPAPMSQAVLSGTLELMGPETGDSYDDRPASATRGSSGFGGRTLTPLMTLESTGPVDLSANSERAFETSLSLVDDISVISPVPGQTILMRLRLEGQMPAGYAAEPTLLPGGTLKLPLNEYADPVDATFLTDSIKLRLESEQERWANPGDVLVLRAAIENTLAEAMTVGLQISGQGAAWSAISGPASMEIAPGSAATSTIVLSIPDTAENADRADLVLEVFDVADPTLRSLVRFVAHVDTTQEWDDDSSIAANLQETVEAPAPSIMAILLAIGTLAVLRRTKDE